MSITQILRVMKLTAILLTVCCVHLMAAAGAQTISYSGKNVTLKDIFTAIKKQTGYLVVYNANQISSSQPVTVDAKDQPLTQFLNTVLKGKGLDFAIENKTIVVSPQKKETIQINQGVSPEVSILSPAPIDVKGTIVNEKGEPVAGASVTIKGTKRGTSTNISGEYELKGVNEDATLEISGVNIETIEIKVESRTTVNVSTKMKVVQLEDFTASVSTGYQKVSKERFVGSYAQLDSAAFHRRAGMGIIDRLDGTVTGVVFSKKGGDFPIQVRGISTLGTNSTPTRPLIILDDFPLDDRTEFNINNLNPNDVESVTLLKDAAATSIWGARAGNGVIVITTKKGRFNQRFRISASSNLTIENKPDLYHFKGVSPSDFVDIEQFLFGKGFYDASVNNTGNRPVISTAVEIMARQRNGLITPSVAAKQLDSLRQFDVRNDLNKYLYRPAVRQQHYLSVNGGTNSLSYQLSLGYNHSLNNVQGSKPDDQFTLNSNTTFKLSKRIELQTGVNFSYSTQKSVDIPSLNPLSPYARLVDDQGNPLAIPKDFRMGYIDTAGAGILLDWHYRPLEEIQLANNLRTTRFMRLNVGGGYTINNWLKATIQYQFINGLSATVNNKSIKSYEVRSLINLYTNPNRTDVLRYPFPIGNLLDLSNSQSFSHNARAAFNINKIWSNNQTLTALVAAEISSTGGYANAERFYGYNDNTGSYRTNMDFYTSYPRIYGAFPNSVATIAPTNYSYSELVANRYVSLIANVAYGVKNYNFYASARRDGANIFGVEANNKWKPLWSVGGSWLLSKEEFFRSNWLDLLKIRSSYGYTGNANNTISGRFTMNYAVTPNNFTNLIYANPNLAPNPDLRWEEINITNIGVDYSLFKNRMSGSIDYFIKNASDVLSPLPYPASSGVNSFTVNAAKLRTKGFDISLTSVNTTGLFRWTSQLGFSYAKTIITSLYSNVTFKRVQDFTSFGLNAKEGQIAYGLSSYKWAGLDPVTGDPQGIYKGQVSKDYASIFTDSLQNQVFHGSSIPLYTGFLRNEITWRGLTLSINLTGRFGYYFREPALTLVYTDNSNNYTTDYYRRWQKPGDELITDIPSMPYPASANAVNRNGFYQYAENHVKRGDNIRIQDVRLSYLVNLKKGKGIQNLQLFFYPNNLNLIVWRAESSSFDPDFTGTGSNLYGVVTPITWTTGVTVTF